MMSVAPIRTALLVPGHRLAGGVAAALTAAAVTCREAPPAEALLDLSAGKDADDAIARAGSFAAHDDARVVLLMLPTVPVAGADWAGARAAGLLGGFVRWAAIAWAARGVRVNAIGTEPMPGPDADAGDLAASVLLLLRSPALTGQTVWLTG